MIGTILDFGQIVIADLVLSGDNALIIGMAAASLSPELRRKAILFGMVLAAVLRVVFAVIATLLLGVPGLLLAGGLLLLWVCARLYRDIRAHTQEHAGAALETAESGGYRGPPKRSLSQALVSITVADISMSLDNVLAVAAIADGDAALLVFGLSLAILLMAVAATVIMKILSAYPWISWLGLAVLVYVAFEMLWRGVFDPGHGVVALVT